MDSSDVEDFLNVKLEDLQWQDLAVCSDTPTNLFYDEYESDEMNAKMVDEMCLSCPVLAACGLQGMENQEWGVWGAMYLVNGKPDMKKNAHKTEEVWDELRSRLGG